MSFSTPFTQPFPSPDTTGEVVENQVAFSTYTINNANEFLGALQDSIKNDQITIDASQLADPSFATTPLGSLSRYLELVGNAFPAVPDLPEITGDVPAPPNVDFSALPSVDVPSLGAVAPTLNIPSAPALNLPSVPSPPTLDAIDLPTAPAYALPAVPTLSTVTLPIAPTIQNPTFNASLPLDTLVVPTNQFTWAEAAYQSAAKDALVAKLLGDLQNGGYGIDPADESALWDRERSRQSENTAAAIEEIYRGAAMRGFRLPPGDLNVAVQRAYQDAANKNSAASRDIALKRADMYVDNRKFTIQEVRSLETVMIGYYSSMMERSLNAAKSVLQLGIELFNASVAKYNAQLDAYKTQASVFESQIRAQIAQVEVYRTQLEAARVTLGVQEQQVTVYKAQLEGVNMLVQIYETAVRAQGEKANVQRLKIEAFRGQIDAYAAQVQANLAAANIFDARVRGETARVSAYEAQVRAFTGQVEAAKVRNDSLNNNLRIEIEQANAKSRVYEAQVAGFRATVEKQVEVLRGALGKYNTMAQVYGTRGQVYADAARVGVAQASTEAQMRSRAIDAVIENAKLQLTALSKSADIKVEASRIVGSYVSSIVAGSMSALNTISVISKAG